MDTVIVNNLLLGYNRSTYKQDAIFPAFDISACSSEMVALVGRNGIGKSTFLRTLAGLQKPLAGNLKIMNRPLHDYTQRDLAAVVSFVSTENIRIHNLKVFDLVALGRFPHTNWLGSLTQNDKDKILESIDLVGIRQLAERNISQLSDGELQRTMIARTLAQDTPIIILDEPTAFLDLPNKYEILLLLRRLSREQGKTIIFSTHDLHIAMRLADKIWLMCRQGLQQGAPEDLVRQNAYDELFEGTLLSFEHEHGGIDLGIESTVEIGLINTDNYWLHKALERIGFKVLTGIAINNSNIPLIDVVNISSGEIRLLLQHNNTQHSFSTIYSLGRFLIKEYIL